MLLAYLDEVAAPGCFVSKDHPKFNDCPAFGYAGFVIPEKSSREFGAFFTKNKRELFPDDVAKAENPGQYEKKGSDLLYAKVQEDRPQNVRVLASLFSKLDQLGGNLFYYVTEKPCGTPKETNSGPREFVAREKSALQETLNRLARHAEKQNRNVLCMMDQINEKTREQRLPMMYAHIFARGTHHEEMRRIIEPPMHIDSKLSSNVQFADWVCGFIRRCAEYQLIEDTRYKWIPDSQAALAARGLFTFESKLNLCERSIDDIYHVGILDKRRPVFTPSTIAPTEEAKRQLEMIRRATFR